MRIENPLISIILPTYNEAGNILPLIGSVIDNLKEVNFEIIVVDDNSPDQTASTVLNKYLTDQRIRVFLRTTDRGLAKSILFGIEKASGKFVCVMDTDFNHHPRMITRMLEEIETFDIIVGSRYIKGGGMENSIRYYLSLVYNLTIRMILQLSSHDNLSGFFLTDRKKLLSLQTERIFYGYGDYFIRLMFFAKQKGFRLKEIPVFYKNRLMGKSKSKFVTMFLDYSKTVLKLVNSK